MDNDGKFFMLGPVIVKIIKDNWPRVATLWSLNYLGVTGLEAFDGEPIPIAFFPATVNVYCCPLVRPVTVIGLCGPENVFSAFVPIYGVTIYEVTGSPPSSEAGRVNFTVTCFLPANPVLWQALS